jgi:hypothetical protein
MSITKPETFSRAEYIASCKKQALHHLETERPCDCLLGFLGDLSNSPEPIRISGFILRAMRKLNAGELDTADQMRCFIEEFH